MVKVTFNAAALSSPGHQTCQLQSAGASRNLHPWGSPRSFSSFQQLWTHTAMGSAMGSEQSMGNHRATALRTDCRVHFLRPFQSLLIGQTEVLGHGLGRRPAHCQSLFKHCRALTQCHNHYYFSLCSVTVELFGHTAHECHRSVHTKQKEPKTAVQGVTTKSKLKVTQHKIS